MIELEHLVGGSSIRIDEADRSAGAKGADTRAFDAGSLSFAITDAALDYRARGLALLPLRGKEPAFDLIDRTHGSSSTTQLALAGASDEQIKFWFSHPGVNVGIFCGAPSGGLVVVDVDDADLVADATLPPTPKVTTGRGYHLYYRSATPVSRFGFAGGEVMAKEPRYVVAPPSLHPVLPTRYAWHRGLDELDLADFGQVVLPERAPKSTRSRTNSNGKKKIRPTKAVLLGQCPTRDQAGEGWLRSFDRDTDAVEVMARALGIESPLGKPFRCILHEERNASACLVEVAESGEWLYHDFHGPARGGLEWMSLAQVRAQLSHRGPRLGPAEHATWKLVLLDEAGLVPCQPVPADRLPQGVHGVVRHVYERFLYLLACRWNYGYGEPAPFERNFAAAFCELPVKTARFAIDELRRLEQLVLVGYHGRTRLWLPAGVAPDGRTP